MPGFEDGDIAAELDDRVSAAQARVSVERRVSEASVDNEPREFKNGEDAIEVNGKSASLTGRRDAIETTTQADVQRASESFATVSLTPDRPLEVKREKLGKTQLDGFGHKRSSSASTTPPVTAAPMERSRSADPPAQRSEPMVGSTSQPVAGPSTVKLGKIGKVKPSKSNALQRVISKTRPHHLPPKPRDEDNKHLREFDDMMKDSVKAQQQRKAKEAQHRLAKDLALAADLPTWEKDILPNWRAVLEDERLRKVWWSGTMPARYRANLWSACIGNGLAIGKASYARLLSRALSVVKAGKMPEHVLEAIDEDIAQTLPNVKLFQSDGPMAAELRNVLLAYSIFWSVDRPHYPHGISWPAALLLISMPTTDAFVSLVNLVHKSFLKPFYTGQTDQISAYYRIFATLLADQMPTVYRNFLEHEVRPSLYLHPWLVTLYAQHLPLDCATRLFDVFVLEGDSFPFRAALALLQCLEARLFNPDHAELSAMFRGEDRGAVAIAARDKGVSEDEVGLDDVYVRVTNGGEEPLFEALGQQQWKEKTWLRLIERELPE